MVVTHVEWQEHVCNPAGVLAQAIKVLTGHPYLPAVAFAQGMAMSSFTRLLVWMTYAACVFGQAADDSCTNCDEDENTLLQIGKTDKEVPESDALTSGTQYGHGEMCEFAFPPNITKTCKPKKNFTVACCNELKLGNHDVPDCFNDPDKKAAKHCREHESECCS